MDPQEDLVYVIDFILNRANPEALEAVRMALERRGGGQPSRFTGPMGGTGMTSDHGNVMDIQSIAKKYADELQASIDIDIPGMSRRLVRNMIKTHEPTIPEEHLDALVDHFVPDPNRPSPSAESNIPRDVLVTMVRQFVDYSVGRMKDRELKELKSASPDWVEKYWNAFPDHVRKLVSDLIRGNMGEK
ncbi:MAG TPA: hypothetical protein DEA96_13090, partial [Leptospiraceae bacterium]|nr:hypothetical protein [Leptospiraceae bacterium]